MEQIQRGSSYFFGRYGGEAIEWRVLEVEGDRALLITEWAIDCKRFHNVRQHLTWSQCDLRAWLNGEFLSTAFDEAERARILEVELSNPDNQEQETPGGPDTRDRVFCLSIDEALRYFASNDKRMCSPTVLAYLSGALLMSIAV